MDMNREAVNIALGLAGNLPMTDNDKKYNNLAYLFPKQLYLPTLFSCLTALDWKSGRKEARIKAPLRYMPKDGRYYYELPADCIKPLYVDNNTAQFFNDRDLIITNTPVEKLYYVYHNRNFNYSALAAPDKMRDRSVVVAAPSTEEEIILALQRAEDDGGDNSNDDFPQWAWTEYDNDFWEYFSYKLAARLVPKLRSDDGAAGRAQALENLAANIGQEAMKKSNAASTSPAPKQLYWYEKLGLQVSYRGGRTARDWRADG